MTSKPPYRVVAIDDAADVRFLIELQLADEPDFELIGEGGSPLEAIALADEEPDVLLLDLHLGTGSAPETIHGIKAVAPATKVVIVSGADDRATLKPVFDAGAAAFLDKLRLSELPGVLRRLLEDHQLVA